MRNMQSLISKHRMGRPAAPSAGQSPADLQTARVAATVDALNALESIISCASFGHPEALTHDRITAYALALMRLRECAGLAGLERLKNACDALAVTVARLIEDRSTACRTHCEALSRFVRHAEEMIRMATECNRYHARPVPEFQAASGVRTSG